MKQPKVVLATVGSYGDLHPFIAVALELQARGVNAVIAATPDYREKIEREGIGFHPVRPDAATVQRVTGRVIEHLAAEVTRHSAIFIFETFILPYMAEACADLETAMADADLVVVSSLAMPAQIMVDVLGKPSICAPLQPIVMMSAEDPPVVEEFTALPAIRRLFGPKVVAWMLDQGRRRFRAINDRVEAQRRVYDLPKAYGDAISDGAYRADETVALYSPLLGGARTDPPVPTTVAGFAFFDRDGPADEPLADEAQAFLDGGDPPIVFTLGSFAVLAAGRFYEDAVVASRALGRRAVLMVGRDNEARLREALSADDVLVLGYAPHSQIFPRAAVVVHHGGVGTTGQALRAGAPQLVCWMFGDQPDNAHRIERLGVGGILRFRRFEPRRAVKALKPLLDDPAIRARALAAAATVGQEDGARVMADHVMARLAAT